MGSRVVGSQCVVYQPTTGPSGSFHHLPYTHLKYFVATCILYFVFFTFFFCLFFSSALSAKGTPMLGIFLSYFLFNTTLCMQLVSTHQQSLRYSVKITLRKGMHNPRE